MPELPFNSIQLPLPPVETSGVRVESGRKAVRSASGAKSFRDHLHRAERRKPAQSAPRKQAPVDADAPRQADRDAPAADRSAADDREPPPAAKQASAAQQDDKKPAANQHSAVPPADSDQVQAADDDVQASADSEDDEIVAATAAGAVIAARQDVQNVDIESDAIPAESVPSETVPPANGQALQASQLAVPATGGSANDVPTAEAASSTAEDEKPNIASNAGNADDSVAKSPKAAPITPDLPQPAAGNLPSDEGSTSDGTDQPVENAPSAIGRPANGTPTNGVPGTGAVSDQPAPVRRRMIAPPPPVVTSQAVQADPSPPMFGQVDNGGSTATRPPADSAVHNAGNEFAGSVEHPSAAAAAPSTSANDARPIEILGLKTGAPRLGGSGTAAQGADVERVRFIQRVARAFQAAGDHGGTVRLRLSPPELGSLRLEVSLRDGVMAARIEAETPQAQNLLAENLPALRTRLDEQNIHIDRFDIDLMHHPQGGPPRDSSRDAQPQEMPALGGDRSLPRRAAAIAESAPSALRPAIEINRINVVV